MVRDINIARYMSTATEFFRPAGDTVNPENEVNRPAKDRKQDDDANPCNRRPGIMFCNKGVARCGYCRCQVDEPEKDGP